MIVCAHTRAGTGVPVLRCIRKVRISVFRCAPNARSANLRSACPRRIFTTEGKKEKETVRPRVRKEGENKNKKKKKMKERKTMNGNGGSVAATAATAATVAKRRVKDEGDRRVATGEKKKREEG